MSSPRPGRRRAPMDTSSIRRGLSPDLAAAILALGFAVDETGARYWLALCARRGADADLLTHLWSTWLEQNAPTVITSTPREEPRP